MANLHAFVTDALTECLKVLISLDSFNIFRAQPIQSIQNTTAEWKTATTASRSLNTVGEAQQSTYFKHYMHQQTSTNINIHQQNPMYTSTACWQRLSTRQCTAWPLHPTRRRGLLWQRALLNSSHRNTNLGKNPEQSLANASGKDCVRKHWHVRTWQNVAEQNIVWTQRRAFAVEASGNPGDGGNPAGDSAVTSAGRKWKKSEPAMAIYTCMSPTQEQKNLNIMN